MARGGRRAMGAYPRLNPGGWLVTRQPAGSNVVLEVGGLRVLIRVMQVGGDVATLAFDAPAGCRVLYSARLVGAAAGGPPAPGGDGGRA